jgi:monooxygenase
VNDTDFCIVGGGPAGLTLALLLVRSGARVTVLERSRSLDREYRGDILQPGGMTLLDELGVLAGARARGSHPHERFLLMERDRVLINGDYRVLPGRFNFLLSLPQRNLLEELLEQCHRYDGFEYLAGHRVTKLITEGDVVRGATATGPDGPRSVRAMCVIAADGRYSKVRRLAGIDGGRLDVFDQDVLWFKVPVDGALPDHVRISRGDGNPVLAYATMPDSVQIGWTLPHGAYPVMAAKGFEHVRELLCAAVPDYADLIRKHITAMSDLTLLDVFSGTAPEWVRDGLVLIGDSAHTLGPIGAQGINLAVQDAVALHPILMAALADGDASAARLARFVAVRKPAIDRMLRLQRIQSRGMLSNGALVSALRPRLAPLMNRSPLYRRVFAEIAFGDRRLHVSSDLLVAAPKG